MATKSNWWTQAPDIVRSELQNRLPGDFKIVNVEPDSFFHEGEEFRSVIVTFKKGHPIIDFELFYRLEHDLCNLLDERGFDPVPFVEYQVDGVNVV